MEEDTLTNTVPESNLRSAWLEDFDLLLKEADPWNVARRAALLALHCIARERDGSRGAAGRGSAEREEGVKRLRRIDSQATPA